MRTIFSRLQSANLPLDASKTYTLVLFWGIHGFHLTAESPQESKGQTDILKAWNDTSWWQCMFAHTHRRSLSLLLPWTSLQGASILLTLSTPSTLKKPLYVPLTRTFPETQTCTPLEDESCKIQCLSLLWKTYGNEYIVNKYYIQF